MPRAIAVFRERHPVVELSLEPAEPPRGAREAARGRVRHRADDRRAVRAPRRRRHRAQAPARRPDVRRAAERAPARAKPRDPARGARVDPWIGGSSGGCPDTLILLRACHAAGFEPRIAFHSDDYLAIQGFVAAGVGVSLIPDLALLAVRDDVAIRSLASRAPFRSVQAATLQDGYRSPAVDAMLGSSLEVCERVRRRAPRARDRLLDDRSPRRRASLQCAEEDSNLHGVIPHKALNLARLPIPPPARGERHRSAVASVHRRPYGLRTHVRYSRRNPS